MQAGLDGRVAIVTGGSRGIGAATAAALAAEGCGVAVVSRKQETLETVARQIRDRVPGAEVLPLAAHVAHADDAAATIEAVQEHFGRLDVLVNNAAANPHYGPMLDISQSQAEKVVSVNLWGPLLWTQAAADLLAADGGSVVNVASIGGLVTEPGIGWYNAAKAALIHLTRQLAMELGPRVRVNAVAPGLVRTDFARALWEEHEEQLAKAIPAGRIGEPDDVAGAVVFLASQAARWVTGQTLVVDGGTTVRPMVA